MSRPKLTLSHAVQSEIAARTARGESAATVRAAMGTKISLTTIKRLQADQRGGKPARAVPASKSETKRTAPDTTTSTSDEDEDVDRVCALVDELGGLLDGMIERAVSDERERVRLVVEKVEALRATYPACSKCGVRSKGSTS